MVLAGKCRTTTDLAEKGDRDGCYLYLIHEICCRSICEICGRLKAGPSTSLHSVQDDKFYLSFGRNIR